MKDKWLNIGSAPKSGNSILLWNGRKRAIGFWHEWIRNRGMVVGLENMPQENYVDAWCWNTGDKCEPQPTHWMLLPNPPTGDYMSKKIDNGGDAFPKMAQSEPLITGSRGMTLRDYFAAQALQCFTAGTVLIENPRSDEYTKKQTGQMARFAYFLADEMIKTRQSNDR